MSNPSPSLPAPAATGPRWKKIVKRLGVLALAMLLAGFVAEGLVLLILGEQVKFPRHVVAAPFGLRINQPNAVYRHKSPDVEVWFRINGQGMRADRDYPKAKPPGVKRILSLGDSFTIGYEVNVEDCFSSVLERELRAKGYAVEVLNAGVSGYSTAEECLYLERELFQYQPDLVLVSFYTNDLQDNLRTELFRLDGDVLTRDRPEYVPLGRLGNFLNTNPILSFLSSYSNAFALLKETFTREYKTELTAEIRADIRKEKTEELQEREQEKAAEAPPAPVEPAAGVQESPRETPAVPPPQDPPDFSNAVGKIPKRLAASILQRMLDDCRSRGIAFVVQVIPSLGDDQNGDDKLSTPFPITMFDRNQPGSGLVDARDFLEPWVGKKQLYWLRSHHHWTPFSHELSGKALAEYIDSRGMLGR